MNVDENRLRADLEANAEFGAIDAPEGRGRTVLTGTDPHRSAVDHFVDRLEAAGLSVRIDAVGNVVGRWEPDSADPNAAAVASGSHLDSVPEGGIFDGPLGVYAALESVRAMQDAGVEPARPVEVVSFTEEEGTRFPGTLGSSVATGATGVEEVLGTTDEDGVTLEAALESIDLRGEGRVDATGWEAFLELHVEQAERLEDAGVPVGVVTSITGIARCSVEFVGEANHAGTTAMGNRRDALCAASEFVLDVERAANELVAAESPTAVGTVGKLAVRPNATNVVAGGVDLDVDIRDVTADPIDELVDRARGSAARIERERGVETRFERAYDLDPIPMADRCRDALNRAANDAGIAAMDLHSGAGHDAMQVGRVTDAGMLFAPSRDGISHSPREWTDWADCAAATRVLAGALADLAGAGDR